MSSFSDENRKIARNTLFLYVRMVFLMIVSLYTSRVILHVLGVEDFGLYNVVGGIVLLFSFLSNALNNSCTKIFSASLATGSIEKVQRSFGASLQVHLVLGLFLLLVLETCGLWYVINKLNVPAGSEHTAVVIFHLAVATCFFQILRTPFASSVIAHEKMSVYAWTSILEGVLKLLIAWGLLIVESDRVIFYSTLVLLSNILVTSIFAVYSVRKFSGNALNLSSSREDVKEMFSFSGWNILSGSVDAGYQHGSSLVLNAFYGVSLNATMGIANQVRTAIFMIVSNMQLAANPQIIMAYTSGDKERFSSLVYTMSKFSLFLILFFVIPMTVNMNYLLKIWLVDVPAYLVSFTTFILAIAVIESLVNPMWVSIQATGDIKVYTIVSSLLLLSNLPLSYFFFSLGYAPDAMMWIRMAVHFSYLVFLVIYTCRKVQLSLSYYTTYVIIPSLAVLVLSLAVVIPVAMLFDGFVRLLISTLLTIAVMMVGILTVGTTRSEKEVIHSFIYSKLLRRN